MKTYALRKGMVVRLADGRTAQLVDSARRLVRLVGTGEPPRLEYVCSFDIHAYVGLDGFWHGDLEYSQEEERQRHRRRLAPPSFESRAPGVTL